MSTTLSFPLVMMIADRGSLKTNSYGVHDEEGLLKLIKKWSDAGVNVIQIRGDARTDNELVEFVKQVLIQVDRKQTRVLVNDRPDIALVAGADGVHLKDDGSTASEIKSIGPANWVVGCSVHSSLGASKVSLDGAADYILVGNVFATNSKLGRPGLGVEKLRNIVTASEVPVVAVGGLSFSNIAGVAGTGIHGIAGIGAFMRKNGRLREDRLTLVSDCYRKLGRIV